MNVKDQKKGSWLDLLKPPQQNSRGGFLMLSFEQ